MEPMKGVLKIVWTDKDLGPQRDAHHNGELCVPGETLSGYPDGRNTFLRKSRGWVRLRGLLESEELRT